MYRTLLITDGSLAEKELKAACAAGIDAIQLRAKQKEGGELYEHAKKLRLLTRLYGVLLFINERIDIALAVNADGVHLPEGNFPSSLVKQLSSSLLVGVSVHSLKEAQKAEREGADVVHFGPIFETQVKKEVQGLAKLEEVAKGVSIPVIAVGGVTPLRALHCLNAGAYGIASISAFSQSTNITETVEAFQEAFPAVQKNYFGLQVILNMEQLDLLDKVIEGGARSIQMRHKGSFTKENLKKVALSAAHCQKKGVDFIINDRVDIALAVRASGVHLGQDALPVRIARKMLGLKKIIGATASTLKQALKAEAEGATYIGFGHIFPTTSKVKNGDALGLERLRFAREKISIPLFAVGGVTAENVASVCSCGVDGIAVIAAVTQAPDPFLATKYLSQHCMNLKKASLN